RDPLRAAHRPAAVPRRNRRGNDAPGADRRAGVAEPFAAEVSPRPGDNLSEMPAKAAAPALRQRAGAGGGPAPFPGRSADPGPARRTAAAGAEMDAAATRDRGTRRVAPPGRHPGRRHGELVVVAGRGGLEDRKRRPGARTHGAGERTHGEGG